VNGGGFQAYVVTKRGFPAKNSPENGERARSLLCGREALAKPPGAAACAKASILLKSREFFCLG